MSYMNAALYLAGCSGYAISQCRLDAQSSSGLLKREASMARSDFFDRAMSSTMADRLISHIDDRSSGSALSRQEGGILLDDWGEQIAQVGSTATAFPHRGAAFLAQEF